MEKNIDKKLMTAYAQLCAREKRKITVTSLCKKADIARATFYIYYNSIEEYSDALKNYIFDILCRQAVLFMECDKNDIAWNAKKSNLLFGDQEIVLLRHFADGLKQISFMNAVDNHIKSPINQEIYGHLSDEERHTLKVRHDFFICGYMSTLYYGIVSYNSVNLEHEIMQCRRFYELILNEFNK